MTQSTQNAGETTTPANGTETPQSSGTNTSSRFVTVQTQRFMYNVDECKAKPLVGWLLSLVQMPPIDNRIWHAFVIRTTEETLGLDRDEKVVPVPVGSDVLIPATHELAQYLMKPAFNPRAVYEVRIQPKVKIDVGRSKQMWTYGIDANPVPLPRAQFGLAALVGRQPKALTWTVTPGGEDGNPLGGGGFNGGDDEIPF